MIIQLAQLLPLQILLLLQFTSKSYGFALKSATTIKNPTQMRCRKQHGVYNTKLQMIPLSRLVNGEDTSSTTERIKPTLSFFSRSDSYRTCITSNGTLRDDSKTTEGDKYLLGVAEEDDLPSVTNLQLAAFDSHTITLSSQFSRLEQTLLKPGVDIWNMYSNGMAFMEVLGGLRKRTTTIRNRIKQLGGHDYDDSDVGDDAVGGDKYQLLFSSPTVPTTTLKNNPSQTSTENITISQDQIVGESSIILVLSKKTTATSKDDENEDDSVIASVELRVQPPDAKIPFSEPWMDRLERRFYKKILNFRKKRKNGKKKKDGKDSEQTGNTTTKDHAEVETEAVQPYLSNLCVDSSFRGRRIGKALVRCVESIAKDCWGYDKIYLHVDLDNAVALSLYKDEGYRDVGLRWNPFWAKNGGGNDIGYFVKDL